MHADYENSSDLYKTIRETAGLRWLLHQPELIGRRNQLEEYEWVTENVKRFRNHFYWLAFTFELLLSCVCGAMIIFAYHKWGLDTWMMLFVSAVSIILMIVSLAFAFCLYLPEQERFIDLWIDANWKSKRFPQEVRCILKGNHSSELLRSHSVLAGTALEIDRGSVPLQVSRECDSYLFAEELSICELEVQKKLAGWPERKQKFSDDLQVYKKYKILPKERTVEHYRQRALKQLNANKNVTASAPK